MEADLCSEEESLQSPVGGYKGDKNTKDTYPPWCGVPSGRREQSLGFRGEATGTQSHLPAYSWAFLQAEKEYILVRPHP